MCVIHVYVVVYLLGLDHDRHQRDKHDCRGQDQRLQFLVASVVHIYLSYDQKT